MTSVSQLDLDLDVFQGPFDLLLAVLLREEISLAEVSLGDIVLAYVDRLEEVGEVDLESVTEFLVLVAALLELKSRLLLPTEEAELDLGPEEAADELLARMLEYRRYREAAEVLDQILEREGGTLYRSAPPPPELRRAAVKAAVQAYEPDRLGSALGDLLTPPPSPDLGHIRTTSRSSGASASSATCSGPAGPSTSTRPSAARTASRRPSRCSHCWRCTAEGKRPGPRRTPSARSR